MSDGWGRTEERAAATELSAKCARDFLHFSFRFFLATALLPHKVYILRRFGHPAALKLLRRTAITTHFLSSTNFPLCHSLPRGYEKRASAVSTTATPNFPSVMHAAIAPLFHSTSINLLFIPTLYSILVQCSRCLKERPYDL